MHVEIALNSSRMGHMPRADQSLIRKGLAFLRAGSEYWHSIKWTLRMFDAIISKSGLILAEMGAMNPDQHCSNQVHWGTHECQYQHSSNTGKTGLGSATDRAEQPEPLGSIELGFAFNGDSGNVTDPVFDSLMEGGNPENWLDDLLLEDAFALNNI